MTVPRAGEFDLIARYFAPLAKTHPGAFGLLDDGAVFSEGGADWVVTTDTMVAGRHFAPETGPSRIARKLLRVNLSDLAAMGAVPRHYLLSASFPISTEEAWIADFAAGLDADQKTFGVSLIGGDTTATDGPAVFTVTALGTVEKGRALRRRGAVAGDRVFVSGTVGDGVLGLRAARGELDFLPATQRDYLVDRLELPSPRTTLGAALAGLAHAAIDVSDGLIADLGHIASASAVGMAVHWSDIPLSDAAAAAVARNDGLIEAVLTGGDDYEIAFTVPAARTDEMPAMAARLGVRLTPIGVVTAEPGVVAFDRRGAPMALPAPGYTHF